MVELAIHPGTSVSAAWLSCGWRSWPSHLAGNQREDALGLSGLVRMIHAADL